MDPNFVRSTCLLFLPVSLAIGGAIASCDEVPDSMTRTNPNVVGKAPSSLRRLSLTQLEHHQSVIDERLSQLSPISLRSGVGAVGCQSTVGPKEWREEWFQIDLDETFPIDCIMLVPTIWRDTKTGPRDDGFPLEFRIVAGTQDDPSGVVVASYTADDQLLPRIAPLVVSFPPIVASWVRVEAFRLSPRLWDAQFVLQLSEIMVFSGPENVALNQTVSTSSGGEMGGAAREKRFLVDGFVPYLMDAMEGEKSIAFARKLDPDTDPELTIDLGTIRKLNRIHLHSVELSDTIPQSHRDGYGIPRHLLVEGADLADFSDAVRIIEFESKTDYDFGPIIMKRFPETSCRYLRLTGTNSDRLERDDSLPEGLGFAEIEIFSEGKNVAVGLPVHANFTEENPLRSLFSVTDGRNFYGEILPVRDWLAELAQRHDLEVKRPLVIKELGRRYRQQRVHLAWVTWLAVLLALGIGITIMIDRFVQKRQLANLKERFAADLHDELGANLHVIGLLGDLAQASVDSPKKLIGLHQRIRTMTERSAMAVQCGINIADANDLHQDLHLDMQRTTERIMADIEGRLSFTGSDEDIQHLKPRTRADLFLFYKECLVNISRHSEATQFSAQLISSPTELNLIVSDNGHGLATHSDNFVPPSLARRARLLGAKVTATHPDEGGTRLCLNLQTRKWGRRK